MILVSACLMGINCKYHGGNNINKDVIDYLKDKTYLAVCPETIGGLSVPRAPVELVGGGGEDFWQGKSQAKNKDGTDVSSQFTAGAKALLDICEKNTIELAIFKDGSPTCGNHLIYDGSFSSKKIPGNGVMSALLKNNGIKVISEDDITNCFEWPTLFD